VAFWSALAEDQGRRYELALPSGPCEVGVPPEELAAVLDALLGNVLSHTPEGCRFTVSVAPRASGGGRLVIEDEGPGIPDASVVARGASGAGSTGLGLDIVRRAAEASGGSAAVGHRPGGGARVTVDLGPP
jgi:signal transduction histidine kinase